MKDYFIHTIGIQTYLTDVHLDSLCRAYDGVKNENNDPVCYFDQTEKKRIFSKYAHMGFRMKIDFANPTVKKFDSRKRNIRRNGLSLLRSCCTTDSPWLSYSRLKNM